ncbi:ABC transporter ATP-binding protein [Micromonospora sp. NBC_01796]|uniref:ABC transporter ATP-binding protein n=1 Tax=Micromonospora sp. NBC_01796 TaxID=2975987 RepID=UPI002DDB0715|nr:ABC transporter ATP-binding protein [Micromonospora sp. NBC_01796]WSA83833.1 ABC transporter ATP-binding protein [Micromonospora sp. NBC_01796]
MSTSPRPPVIALRQAGLVYPGSPSYEALKPCELFVEAGQYVTVVGPSGSGKSTLLNILALLDRPTTGTYELDGIHTELLAESDRTALRGHRIGFVFQAFQLLPHRTAVENVAMAMVYKGVPSSSRRRRAIQALDKVGLSHRLGYLPSRLSGGERQRVAIARGLVTEPSLLLCDEPTGNLDSANAEAILGLFDKLWAGGMTLVVVTHDPTVANRGQRRLEIVDGRIISDILNPMRSAC